MIKKKKENRIGEDIIWKKRKKRKKEEDEEKEKIDMKERMDRNIERIDYMWIEERVNINKDWRRI